jgi:hypothetical protein
MSSYDERIKAMEDVLRRVGICPSCLKEVEDMGKLDKCICCKANEAMAKDRPHWTVDKDGECRVLFKS